MSRKRETLKQDLHLRMRGVTLNTARNTVQSNKGEAVA